MDLLLGLDVGTTATKALLFDLQGGVVASASYEYGLSTPQETWVEQDPEDLWRGVVETSRSVAAQARPGDRIVALAQSSQGGTTIPIGADGQPTYPAISWMDGRAAEQAAQVRDEPGPDFIKGLTGWPVMDGLPLLHIRWLAQHDPKILAATRYFLFVNDYITHRLTGRLSMNPADASITQLMDISKATWDQRLLDIAGITESQISPLHPSGYAVGPLTAGASAATGLPQDVLVVNGAHDQYCAAVGAGVTRPGSMLLSCGTAWVLLAVPESLEVGLQTGMAVSCHAVEGRWGIMLAMGGVGTALEWLLENVWRGKEPGLNRSGMYDAVNRAAAQSPAGVQGLRFFPLAGGHSATIGTNRGGFVGLSLAHTRGDMARAVMEGVAFELRWALAEISSAGVHVDELKMVGGAAESPIWPQIVADVTGLPVALPTLRQAASRGAAILAGVGAGVFADAEAGFAAFRGQETRLVPSVQHRALYDDAFRDYQELCELLASRWKNEKV
jgi:xylulokinase